MNQPDHIASRERGWFVMVQFPAMFQALRQIRGAEDAGVTLAVLWVAIGHIPHNDDTIRATVGKIATEAMVTVPQASRALRRLCEFGILERIGRGRFKMNPYYAWRGALTAREQAMAATSNVVRLPLP